MEETLGEKGVRNETDFISLAWRIIFEYPLSGPERPGKF
jgi:hypothetical protein